MNKLSFRKGLVLLTTALFLVGGLFVANTAQAAYTQADFVAFDGVGSTTLPTNHANGYTLSSSITTTYDGGAGTLGSPVLLNLTGYAPIVIPWFYIGNPNMTTYDYVTIGIKKPAGFTGISITGGTAVFSSGVMRYGGDTPTGYLMGAGSTPLATEGAASTYLDFSFGANREYVKNGLVYLEVIWNEGSTPEYFTINVTGLHASPVFNATTVAATGITPSDATLNGINGDVAATGHSFWASLDTFSTTSPTLPDGVFSTLDLGAINANIAFPALLSSTGITVTPSTTYYFAAWSNVGGTWYPGAVLSFTTAPAPVVVAPTLSLSGVPATVTTEAAIPETSGVIGSSFDTTKGTLIQATLTKGSADYSNVRVVVTGLTSGVQLIAQDTTGIWYNIAVTGWGPLAGFNLATVTTPVYLVANTAGTYTATINLVNVSNANAVLATTTASVTANTPTPPPSHGGGGGYLHAATPAVPANVATPDGCAAGNKFSTTTGRNCNAATPAVPAGKVLGAASFHFSLFMKNGSNGSEIIELQKFLTALGYTLTADGSFGPKTKGAVVKFQIANKLKGDGIVGALTREVLNK